MTIRAASAAEVEPLLEAAFDSRGVPWLERLPHIDRFVALEVGGTLVSTAALRTLPWSDGVRVTAVGLVCTYPAARGRGHASALLRALPRPAVLWAARHDLYERGDWKLADSGLMGTAEGEPEAAPVAGSAQADVEQLRGDGLRLERDARPYHALPAPALTAVTHVAGGAYALVGIPRATNYLYELGGDPAGFEAVWARVRAGVARVIVNAEADTPAALWLARDCAVQFRPQALALWSGAASHRYVSWIDRI